MIRLGDAIELATKAWGDGIQPDPAYEVSEFAEAHVELPRSSSRESGRWRNDRMPFLVEPLNCLSARTGVGETTLCKPAQTGGTTIMVAWILYTIAVAPAPFFLVTGNKEMAKVLAKTRIVPSMRASALVRKRMREQRLKEDTENELMLMLFPGGSLHLAGAQSPAGLRMVTARKLAGDEIDVWPLSAGQEGDPWSLAKRALRTYGELAQTLAISTPTIEGRSRIRDAYDRGDQGRHFVPCPLCGAPQILSFRRLEWDEGDTSTVAMRCSKCERLFREEHKTKMLARGVWMVRHPERSERHRSFWWNALYSPLGMRSWKQVVEGFLEAKAKGREALMVWVNQDLAETFKNTAETPEWEELYRRREKYPLGRVPPKGLVLTAGVDVQQNRLEVEVVAWGRGLESWSVDYAVFHGDTTKDEGPWRDLAQYLQRDWPSWTGTPMRIERVGVDTGWQTQQVYQWARGQSPRQVLLLKGDKTSYDGLFIKRVTPIDVTDAGRKVRARGLYLYTVAVSLAKEELYRWLRQKPPLNPERDGFPMGWCHFPEYDEEHFKQVCSESLVARTSGLRRRYEWDPHYRNERLDCRVYARSALEILGAPRWTDETWNRLESELINRAKSVSRPKGRGSGSADDFLPSEFRL